MDDPLLPHIVDQLAKADQADIVVSFASESGVDRVFEHLRDLLDRDGRLRILTGDYWQPGVEVQRRTEGGEAPHWQSATTENTGSI